MTHAVIVDDNPSFLRYVTLCLTKQDFEVTSLSVGKDLLGCMWERAADIVLLDRFLPDCDGYRLCQKVKELYPDVPLLMFSTAGEAQDVIHGLKLGADDYLPKPFSPEMLLAKIEAVSRRYRKAEKPCGKVIQVGALRIHTASCEVELAGNRLQLTKSEYMILVAMAQNPGVVVERAEIMQRALGYSGNMRSLETNVAFHVTALRKKMGDFREYIQTVRGFGYRLVATAGTSHQG